MGTESKGHESFCKGPIHTFLLLGKGRKSTQLATDQCPKCFLLLAHGVERRGSRDNMRGHRRYFVRQVQQPQHSKTCIHFPNKSGKISPPKIRNSRKNPKKKKHANAGLGSHQLQQRPVLYRVYGFRLNPKSARKLGLHRGELFIVVSAPR